MKKLLTDLTDYRNQFDPSVEVDEETRRTARRIERMKGILERRQPDVHVVLENVHDRHNVAAVMRSCDAIGAENLHLIYSQEQMPKVGSTTSAGVMKWMNVEQYRRVEDCVGRLKQEGCTILATNLTSDAVSLFDLDLTGPIALVFGNEHRGVSEEISTAADSNFHIPMAGFVTSLNISVACAVTLYEVLRQRMYSGQYDDPKLTDDERDLRLQEWIRK